MARIDGRKNKQLRKIKITPDYLEGPHGAVLIEMGRTKILCTAMIQEGVPRFLKGKGVGWLTAEYALLPASTPERSTRSVNRLRADGRALEIQRLIGRVLRVVIDLESIGERTIWVDCDVMQADGGTRTAAITAGFIAVMLAMKKVQLKAGVVEEYLAAVSVGIVDGKPMLDLCYQEDSRAEVDMNVVKTDSDQIVEIQVTAEKTPFSRKEFNALLDLADKGIKELIQVQKDGLKEKSLLFMAYR